ncbi:hypothetical protein IAD21_06453 (plasmid) [Abditibacteriota bacterium]|nr:hypothetical protein IAD21_06453 [Abditibacteriota bacterium]
MVSEETTTPATAAVPGTPILVLRLQLVVGQEPRLDKAPTAVILHHRVREIAFHIPWYGFKTQARLAHDTQVVPSTISRLLRGKELPSLLVALRLTQTLSQRVGYPLDVREVFSLDGSYPTPSVQSRQRCR